jgi:carboxyl-terminal processing protease
MVEKNYVEPVEGNKLMQGAINGMIKSLDPHSVFMTAEMFKELEVETRGSFGGLGIEITILKDVLTVVSPIEDTPAYNAGIKAGDQIIKIDDKSTKISPSRKR